MLYSTNKSTESDYMQKQNIFNLEKQLFSTLKNYDIINFSTGHLIKHKVLSTIADNKQKLLKLLYENLSELDLYFIENLFYTFDPIWIEVKKLEQILNIFNLEIQRRKFLKKNKYKNKKKIDINTIPIAEVIWKYVILPNNLRRNIVCPIHKEKTGSFRVYTNSNSRYCFGCKKGWNIINFIADLENITTKEAYKILLNNFN